MGGNLVVLQPLLFRYLFKLHNAVNPDGWVEKNALDSGTNQVKYIYRLKRELSHIDGVTIESDRAGRYRLRIDESKVFAQRVQASAKVAEK